MIAYTGCVSFNHTYGCQKCTVAGKSIKHRMSFTNLNAVRRTDEMFRNREQPEHHHYYSVIEELEFDMIGAFSIADVLHLIELGMSIDRIRIESVSNLYNNLLYIHYRACSRYIIS